MPTTLTGAILLLLLAVPGIAYTAVRRRRLPQRDRSAFSEIAILAMVSIAADTVTAFLCWALTALPSVTELDISSLIAAPQAYLSINYLRFGLWLVVFLTIATTLAVASGVAANRYLPVHPSDGSSWNVLFVKWRRRGPIHVGLELDDGSWIEGTLRSSSDSAYDIPDRDLILVAPLRHRPAGADELQTCESSAVCVSAKNIRLMHVTYLSPEADRIIRRHEDSHEVVSDVGVEDSADSKLQVEDHR